ncbi:TonB-dependent receptor [Chitinophaga parva]|uniref:TonB-dependent receptor n=1 Tax=Chitinophaga parva TaxID=2169414 RepID=A0A2T7BBH5_9BACT|nr:TonB-dependent receptor [Chitinophaga parva]PUZ21745.1 TonB-dependent receptor [Chitinophaga parva]
MKLITFCLTSTFLLTSLASQAQSGSAQLKGAVQQADNKPVEFATVMLLKAKDSSLVKGAVADVNGRYSFERIQPGKYLLAATNTGMNKVYSAPFSVSGSNDNLSLPPLAMTAATKALKEVNVTGKKPFIEQQTGKTVMNVESSVLAAGGTAMETLEKAPGVTVDKDDNISMKGKNGVIIMIDGRQTNMTQQDLAQMLKSMPASNIESIELISNPSSKYDAAGNAGIINIKLKKNKALGTNGSVNLGVGYSSNARYNGGLNLNHRGAKTNIFGSYNYAHRGGYEDLGLYRTGTENGKYTVYNQQSHSPHNSMYQSVKVGMDYFINKQNTIGVMVDGSNSNWKSPVTGTTNIGNGKVIDSVLRTHNTNEDKGNNWAYNLNYKGVLDTSGKEINVDLDYATNRGRSNAFLVSSMQPDLLKDTFENDTTRSNQPSNIDIRTAKVDYVNPLKHNARLEAGAKVSFVKSDNDATFDSLKVGNWVYDANRSNHFVYQENINAGYVNYSQQFKKWSMQLGLRGEYSHVRGNSMTINRVTDTTYFNLFPNAAFTYNLNKNNALGLSYSRRLQRPSYEDLNPFEFYLDKYTKVSGNPYLRPEYSDNIELSYTFKQAIITSLGYTHIRDMMTRVIEADKDPVTGDSSILRYKYMNVAKGDVVNLNISFPVPITKWWNTYTNLSGSYNNYQTVVNDNKVAVGSYAFFGRTNHTFTLPKGITAEVSYFYMSPQVVNEGLFKMKSMSSLDLGVGKSILNKKGSLKLNVRDLLRTSNFEGEFENAGRFIRVNSNHDTRQVRLTFTYRFGNSNVKAARNRQTGLTDEESRIKQAN